MSEFLLVPVAFFTSGLAAVLGMGGGMLLIACMPGFVPPAAIIPIHAVTQLASNLSRAVFGWRDIDRSIIAPFLLGAAAGAWLGAGVFASINLTWLPTIIGFLILLLTWGRLPVIPGSGNLSLVLLGFYQTGLGMIAGATGPIGGAVLLRRNRGRDWLVVNTAVYMCLNHVLRIAAFALLGFSFIAWWQLLLGMVLAGVAGSWVGTRLRRRVPQRGFQRWFRWLITVLALRMIALPFIT